ncbi:MAG: hypothetical protein LBL45_05365, partial [Treponema sp.]|nr:hypothetical protein [Treponema sp.]
ARLSSGRAHFKKFNSVCGEILDAVCKAAFLFCWRRTNLLFIKMNIGTQGKGGSGRVSEGNGDDLNGDSSGGAGLAVMVDKIKIYRFW